MQVYVKAVENKAIVGAPSLFYATMDNASRFFQIHPTTTPLCCLNLSRIFTSGQLVMFDRG
jgi:hypothetical protein